MIVVPYSNEHLRMLKLQAAQEYFGQVMDQAYAMRLEKQDSFTALQGDTVLCCAGVIRAWPGRALAWALISQSAGPYFVQLTRAMQRYMDLIPDRRVEAVVDSGFDQGHRWLRLLGFQHEGRLRLYTPDGRDVDLYARLRHG